MTECAGGCGERAALAVGWMCGPCREGARILNAKASLAPPFPPPHICSRCGGSKPTDAGYCWPCHHEVLGVIGWTCAAPLCPEHGTPDRSSAPASETEGVTARRLTDEQIATGVDLAERNQIARFPANALAADVLALAAEVRRLRAAPPTPPMHAVKRAFEAMAEVGASRAAPPPDLAEIEGLVDALVLLERCPIHSGRGTWQEWRDARAALDAAVRRLAGSAPATGDLRERLEEAIKRVAPRCPHTEHGQRVCAGCAASAAAREVSRLPDGTFGAPATGTGDEIVRSPLDISGTALAGDDARNEGK